MRDLAYGAPVSDVTARAHMMDTELCRLSLDFIELQNLLSDIRGLTY